MAAYPNILRVAQCSSPQLPNFGGAFFFVFESNVVAKIGVTAIADSSLKKLVDPDWKKYEIAPMASWKQACFQVANSYLDQDKAPEIIFQKTKNTDYFIGAVVIELLQEWVLNRERVESLNKELIIEGVSTLTSVPRLQPFGRWLREVHITVCPECGNIGLDRTDEGWIKCIDEDCAWIAEAYEDALSNTFQQKALEMLQSRSLQLGTVQVSTGISPFEPMMDSIGEAFLDTCIALGLGKDLYWSLINKRQLR
jgi:hypothetical protein